MAASADQLAEQQAKMKERQIAARNAQRVKTRQENRMQASSTTLNIQGPLNDQTVEDPSLPQAQAGAATEMVSIPVSMLSELQRQIDELKTVREAATAAGGGMSFEQLAYFIQEMKKPDAEAQAKIDAEKQRLALNRQNMIELAQLEEDEKRNRQSNCSHRKENNRTAYVVANEKEGMFRYICQHCFFVTEPTKQQPENLGISTGGTFMFGGAVG